MVKAKKNGIINSFELCRKYEDGYDTTILYKDSKTTCEKYAKMFEDAGYKIKRERFENSFGSMIDSFIVDLEIDD